MAERVLITGGAGFIGSHLADALLAKGHQVTAFDALDAQVHGEAARPDYLDPNVELVRGDIRDPEALAPLLRRCDVLFHLAAMVGVGQSMYQIRRYTEINTLGAANVLQLVADDRGSIRKMVVASSMSIYGEGAYRCPTHGLVYPEPRSEAQLAARQWELSCPTCGATLAPAPTAESKPLNPTSIYAINKRDHEEMFMAVGRAYQIPTVALRFFNVYGSRQALSNPYTGAAAIFCSRMLAGQPPLIFEDGEQQRDFTHVSDIVQGCVLAMQRDEADYGVFNVGTGQPLSIRGLAEVLAKELGWRGEPEIAGKYRAGDIRHCHADISLARARLGFEPRVSFEQGVSELVAWVSKQGDVQDRVAAAAAELAARSLTR